MMMMAGEDDAVRFEEKLAILTCIWSNPRPTVDSLAEELPFEGIPEKVEKLIDEGLVGTERKDPDVLILMDEGMHIVEGAACGAGPVFRGERTF